MIYMKMKLWLCFVLVISLALFCISCSNKPKVDDEVGVLETSYGNIVIEFAINSAPKHVANFKELARQGFYDGTRFFRTVKVRSKVVAIQGGDPNTINGARSTWGAGQPGQKSLTTEISKLKHERGIVSAFHKPN